MTDVRAERAHRVLELLIAASPCLSSVAARHNFFPLFLHLPTTYLHYLFSLSLFVFVPQIGALESSSIQVCEKDLGHFFSFILES